MSEVLVPLVANLFVVLLGGGGAFAVIMGRRKQNADADKSSAEASREDAETLRVLEEVWGERISKAVDWAKHAEERASAADERANKADQRADANEAALRGALRKLEDVQDRLDEVTHQMRRHEVTIDVLAERLERHDDPPNGWTTVEVDRRMADRQAR